MFNPYSFERSRETGLIIISREGVRIGSAPTMLAARMVARNHERQLHKASAWLVTVVESGSHNGSCVASGTRSNVRQDVMPADAVEETVRDMCAASGAPVVYRKRMGHADAYRWAWEVNAGSHRFTDMIIAKRIG